MKVPFESAFSDITREVEKIPKQEYLKEGKYPIIDQGDSKIAGYTNREDGVYRNGPVVLFGDHTRVFKYIDFPFFAGADGTKILKAKTGTDTRFGYYSFINHPLNSLGYSRHFKLLKDKPFYTHDYATQLRIAGVLGSLDEKIELNRKKIAELEALAKTIYDYWFVQFDFPDKNGKPYRSSGGKMVWNEQLKREVPEGWEVVPLVDMAAITMGQSPRGDSLNESGEGTLFFQGSSDFGDISPSNRVYTTAPTRMAKSGDILLSVRAPVGTSNIALHPCCIGRGLASLRGKECTNTFIHQALALIKSRFESKNVDGTTFGSLSKDELCNMPILKPASFIIQIFDSFVKPIETNIINLVHQIRELIILRDTLLPLLMNGQAEVG